MKALSRFFGFVGAILLIGPAAAGAAEKERAFTSSDGKSITATLLDVEDGKVKLLLKRGRATLVPLARLSEADQAYALAWAEKYKSKLPLGAIRIAFDKDERVSRPPKEDKKKDDKDKRKIKRTTETSYSMKVENTTSEMIPEVDVYYRVFSSVQRNGGRAKIEEAEAERWEIGDLAAKAGVDTETGVIKAVDWTEGLERESVKTYGVIADVVVDGVLYRRFSFPTNTEQYVKERLKMSGKELETPDYSKGDVRKPEPEEEEFD